MDTFTEDYGNLSINSTASSGNHRKDIDDDLTLYIMRILMYGVTPAVSIFGVVGNCLSMAILVRHGLNKSSNIILLSLAFTDISFLVGFNSIPKVVYDVGFSTKGFHFSNPSVSYAMFILFIFFHLLDYGMAFISLTIPILITLERLVAVQFPLSFRNIVTPKRTWAAILGIYIFWYGLVGYTHYGYHFILENNGTVGHYYQDPPAHPIVVEAIVYFCMRIPPIFTFIGCCFIAFKVKMASVKRMKMTSQGNNSKEANIAASRSFQRTTQMLLTVCAMFTVTCVICGMPSYMPEYFSFTFEGEDGEASNVHAISYQVINIVLCMNSSGNFIIYIVMNKNFRDTFNAMCACGSKSR